MMEQNPEVSRKLTQETFTPLILKACADAEKSGVQMIDLLNALSNAYADVLVGILGSKGAAGLMREHADHLERHATGRADA